MLLVIEHNDFKCPGSHGFQLAQQAVEITDRFDLRIDRLGSVPACLRNPQRDSAAVKSFIKPLELSAYDQARQGILHAALKPNLPFAACNCNAIVCIVEIVFLP